VTKARQQGTQEESFLFRLPEQARPEPKVRMLRHPIWTENKAKLLERSLYYFVLITKHGTYIDGFAGPQNAADANTWAAKLVLESEPRRLRNFHLFDASKRQVQRLQALVHEQPPRILPRKEPDRISMLTTGILIAWCVSCCTLGVSNSGKPPSASWINAHLNANGRR
jgi:hypothetical protein